MSIHLPVQNAAAPVHYTLLIYDTMKTALTDGPFMSQPVSKTIRESLAAKVAAEVTVQ